MATNRRQSTVLSERSRHPSVRTFPPRPNPSGSLGESECLYTNHFVCSFADNIPLYQYDVSIEETNANHPTCYEVKSRTRCASIIQSFLTDNQLDPNVFVWYDERKCLYSTSCLASPQVRTKDRHRLNIKALTNQWSTNDIHAYINGQTNVYPKDAVRILETLLKRSIQDQVEVINNKCYFKTKKAQKLDNGFEKRHGFIQALHLSSSLLTLNIQTKLTTFYSNISLLEFLHLQIGPNRIPLFNDYKRLNHLLNNCLISTPRSCRSRTYEFDRFDSRRPGEIFLQPDQSLIDYFQTKNIQLTQTEYPCIQVYSLDDYHQQCHLPLELCLIKDSQVYNNLLPQAQDNGKQIPTPEERYLEIIKTLQDCHYNSNSLCHAVGFQIEDQQMLDFDARVLPPPEIKSGSHNFASIKDSRIYLEGQLYKPIAISKLAITYFGTNFKQYKSDVERFMDRLVDMMKYFNIYGCHEEHIVEPISEKIDRYFRLMHERKCQLVVCVMNVDREDDFTQLKSQIKRSGTITYGIMTQCTVFPEIPSDEKCLKNYCENLIRKINFKNGGINTIIDLDLALREKTVENESIMFFGADVVHPTNVTRQHPSIAAIVGSGDSTCSMTAVRVCKQYPKQGKCSLEMIVGMREMIEQLLSYNYQVNQRLPTKIIFYRDGVDNGQFRKIQEYEISAIRQAFNQIYGNPSKHPLLTFIIVKKRHHTRFFTYHPKSNPPRYSKSKKLPKETDNMSIGAVIDTTIVHPYEHDFYLNSHNAYQGVNHPSLYHVLCDEIGFTANELQLLTYHLCFADARSSASEAIPSVVHQADIAALKARDLFYNDEADIGERRRNSSPNEIDYEILPVHEKLQNLPVLG